MTDLEKARKLSPCNCPHSIGDTWHRDYCGSLRQAAIAAALKAERDACELLALRARDKFIHSTGNAWSSANEIAAAIHALGEP